MRYYVGLILLSLGLAFSAGCLAFYAQKQSNLVPSPPPALTQLKQQFAAKNRALQEIDLGALFPTGHRAELIDPASKLPQTARYDYKEIRALYLYANSCKSYLVPRHTRKSTAQFSLAKAWTWQKFICGSAKALPKDFFSRGPAMHPSGSSFAWMAYRSGLESFKSPSWLEENLPWFHATEATRLEPIPPGAEQRVLLAELGASALSALARGSETAITDKYFLLRSSESFDPTGDLTGELRYSVFSRATINRYLADSPFSLSVAGPDSSCFQREGNLCWSANEGHFFRRVRFSTLTVFGGAIVLMLALIALLLKKISDERRSDRARTFALRALTHELRTPITNMVLSMETIRSRFDSLESQTQDAFLKTCGDLERLKRLTEASTQYLTLGRSRSAIRLQIQHIESLRDFLEGVLEPYQDAPGGKLQLQAPQPDRGFDLDPYWVALCIKNLVENATQHGSPPVLVTCQVGHALEIMVEDQGQSEYQELSRMSEPFSRSDKTGGLGLGLSIVQQVVDEMGGELFYSARPTRFTLVIPPRRPTEES